jgi:hypothetical protein
LAAVWLPLVLLTGVGVITVLQASPALASCTGSGCTGKDPNAQGCSAVSVQSRTFEGPAGPETLTIQLRKSNGCGAYWARGIRNDCAYPVYTYIREEQQTYISSLGGWISLRVQYKQMSGTCNGGTSWTNMIQNDSGDRHQACMLPSLSGPVNPANVSSGWACTAWIY